LVSTLVAHPEIYTYLALPTMNTPEELNSFYDIHFRNSSSMCLYAVFNKPKSSVGDQTSEQSDETYAGILSLNDTSVTEASTEIGVITFPAYQRSHVTNNALGLLLLWLLDPPSAGGLGLRRVVWKASANNAISRRVAERAGFELEGILRWVRLARAGGLDVNKLEERNGTTGEKMGQHTAVYSIVWDEWEEKREGVVQLMQSRKAEK
jgi:RimJ/RimL family protein N-acetyltransferase